jgi:shikimate dehydrogenase
MTVANRTQAKAAALAALVNDACGRALAQPGPARPAARALIVNATALGMAPDDPLPMDAGRIARDMLVAEVVASPETTAFLHAAQARGADTHSGIWMIRNQVDLIARHLAETGAP